MRCSWVNLKNDLYIKYHDEEWGKPSYDDNYLYEMFILECFQAGLSWECVLNKREAFRFAYDNFDMYKVASYTEEKINELINNKDIIRNKAKVKASINNTKIFIEIKNEYMSFSNFIWSFTNGKVLHNVDSVTNGLSDKISKILYKRGMRFVGSITMYSYLQAIGVINDHEATCDMRKKAL